MMKFRFEPDLDFQLQAVDAVCDLFHGQEVCKSEFTVAVGRFGSQPTLPNFESHLGIGNRLTLLDEEILRNLRSVQLRNGLSPSCYLVSGDFTVEMETGTGKTYVYLRTIFELNKRFGFTKFVVVVPSVAIKEGVKKALQVTAEHFRGLYAGTPFDYFLYDSANLGEVRNFATSQHIQIMVITVGAINRRDVNNLYKDSEKTGGERPIDLIRATRPIIIVDEPQSVDGGLGGRGREALSAMRPLCTLRYSATHVDKHHMIFRLDAIDAYERKLVKQIEIASATVQDAHNRPYVRLIDISSRRGNVSAKVELDVDSDGRVRRRTRVVQDGDDLEQTTGRTVYRGHRIGEIQLGRERDSVELVVPGGQLFLRRGESWGDVDAIAIQRQMIRRTIREHLDKEKRLRPLGIKVLSLFFLDSVEQYRRYDEAGKAVKGEYALLFEEEYHRLSRHPEYNSLFGEVDLGAVVSQVHDGYFSIDRRGRWTNTAENNQAHRDSAERAYSLIMRDKEKLLSLNEPLKFIFSHSALREGWDNPNVFQICVLRDIRTEVWRRQTIGRGLRLCVNQEGRRLRGFDINTLTVIARESYEEFADKLQREIEKDTGIQFGVIVPHQFARIHVTGDDGQTKVFGLEASRALFRHLQVQGYVDRVGLIHDSLRVRLSDDTLSLPDKFAPFRAEIVAGLRKASGRLEIRDANERRLIRPRQRVLASPEFKALWDRIKHKTSYRVSFDNDRLLEDSAKALYEAERIPFTRIQWRKAGVEIGQPGVSATERAGASTIVLDESEIELPDLLTELQDRTQLTRKSIYRILIDSRRIGDFRRNPQRFIELAASAINGCKERALVDGIKYRRLGDEVYFCQELFEQTELSGYLRNIMCPAEKSLHDGVLYDSETEARFAEDLERNSSVKLYAKLPEWFRVKTPLGSYNPDWAMLVYTEDGERLYLVVETKASTLLNNLRRSESDKIECGREHFKALAITDDSARYEVAASVEDLLARSVDS